MKHTMNAVDVSYTGHTRAPRIWKLKNYTENKVSSVFENLQALQFFFSVKLRLCLRVAGQRLR